MGTFIDPLEADAEYRQPLPQEMVPTVDQEYVPEPTLPKDMLAEVLDRVAPLKVTLQEVPNGRPVSVNVTV